jgi:small-conductance mechanosensitive channel
MNLSLNTTFTNHIVNTLQHVVPLLPGALFDLLVGILIIQLLTYVARVTMRLVNVQPGLRGVWSGIIQTILWLLLSIAILNELGFSGIIYFFTGSIFAVGILLSAGGSTLVSDVIAGIFLARDEDFNVGDEIIAGETPTQGVIESMDARRVRLRDDRGVLHVIPNSVVERKEWMVLRRGREVSPLKRAAKVARRATVRATVAAAQKGASVVRKKPPVRKNDQ